MFIWLNAVNYKIDCQTLVNLNTITDIERITYFKNEHGHRKEVDGIIIYFIDGTSKEFTERLSDITKMLKDRNLLS